MGDGPEMANQGNAMHPSKTNGSIITMTLKNNHLIVETEEHGVRIHNTTTLSKPEKMAFWVQYKLQGILLKVFSNKGEAQ